MTIAPEKLDFEQISQQEKIAQEAQSRSRGLSFFDAVHDGYHRITHGKLEKAMTIGTMFGIALTPLALQNADPQIRDASHYLASAVMPAITGAIAGLEIGPVGIFVDGVNHIKLLDKIHRLRGDVTPQELASVLSHYERQVPLSEMKLWTNGKMLEKNKNDPRMEVLHAIQDEFIRERTKDTPKAERATVVAQAKRDAMRQFMRGEFQGQIERGTKPHIARKIAKKTANALLGAVGMTAVVQGIGGFTGESSKDFGALVDDIPTAIAFVGAEPIGKLLNRKPETRPIVDHPRRSGWRNINLPRRQK